MRKNFCLAFSASLSGTLLAAGLAVLPAQADDAKATGQANRPGTTINADLTARARPACGFQVEVHFTDGRTENARWEMAPGKSPTATAFCRSRAAV